MVTNKVLRNEEDFGCSSGFLLFFVVIKRFFANTIGEMPPKPPKKRTKTSRTSSVSDPYKPPRPTVDVAAGVDPTRKNTSVTKKSGGTISAATSYQSYANGSERFGDPKYLQFEGGKQDVNKIWYLSLMHVRKLELRMFGGFICVSHIVKSVHIP